MMFVAPVARIAFTIVCMPAAWKPTPEQVPPSRQHCHAAVESELLSGYGSLWGSKITALLPLNAAATCDQKVTEWSMSSMGCWPVACCVPGALQWISRIALGPFRLRRLTQLLMKFW